MAELLSIRGLSVDYVNAEGAVRAVDCLSLDVEAGEILGIAGESGSGKTTLAKAVMRTLPPPAIITGGRVLFEGQDLMGLEEDDLRQLRWKRISMVFQSAMDALNPVITVGEQLIDTIMAHTDTPKHRALERAGELLELVGMPADRLSAYAHQLSGGMRQRVGIALALALEPTLVILDEPTTALDVIVERDILAEIRHLQQRLGFAVIFITHDLPRMLQVSDRVAILYAARLAEIGPAAAIQRAPHHPYTQGLLHAFPALDARGVAPESIPGAPPSLSKPPSGCRFHPRCAEAVAACSDRPPRIVELAGNRAADCRLVD